MKARKIICLLVFVFLLFLIPSAVNAYDYNGATYNDNDFTKLQTFLNQPSDVEGKTNGQQLNSAYDENDPMTWNGVTWENGRVVRIDCASKSLSGDLDVSDFLEIIYINCNYNSITSINLINDTKLTTIGCENNKITEIKGVNQTSAINTTGCGFIEISTSNYPSCNVYASTSLNSKFKNWTIDGTEISTSKQIVIDFTNNIIANFSKPYYGVSYYSNGGSLIPETTREEGTLIIEPAPPTKTNYIFAGWYKDIGLTTKWDFENDVVTQKTVLYAKWTGIDCTVNFVYNDGTDKITSITAQYGSLITPPSDIPIRDGCVLGGWFQNSDSGPYWDFSTYKVITNVTLYACWYDNYDFNKIKIFLNMPSVQTEIKNGQRINSKYNQDIPYTWTGVIWSSTPIKKVQSINWSDKAFWGILDVSNMSTLGSVSIINCSINSINIDGVSGLKSLVCSNDNLPEIDVGTNLSLETLDCSHNLITSLDLSQNISLKELNCTGNRLATLNVSPNESLSILNCSANQLTSLNLTQNIALTSLTCTWNKLTALDVSYNKNLTYLNCSNNYLIDLNTSQNIYLNYIDCSSNNINSIDVFGTILLNTLHCEHNNLTAMNLTGNLYLNYLYCWDNEISSLDLSNNRQLLELYCGDNLITSLNLTNNTLLAKLSCYSNSLTSLDISQNVDLVYIECYLNQLTELDVTNNIKLISIVCYDNDLTSLNVSQNTALVGLYCQLNQITSLDLSHNTVLRYLKCYSNKLESLNLLHCAKLDEINCSKNLLTQLDVSRIELLDDLYCNDNQLTSLKINEYLRKLYCNNNKLATLDLSTNNGYLHELDCSNNQLKTLYLRGFNWNYLKCSSNQFKNITAPIGSLYNIINITSKSNGYVSIEYKNSQLSLIAEPYPETSLVSWNVENNIISDINPYIIPSFLNGETITANFSKASVTFNSLGGSEVDVITTECGSAITHPAAPVKSGYTFAGWYKEPECINEWNFESDVVTENTTLYAKWNNNENICTVIFDSNGGSIIYDIGVEIGTTLTRSADPTRDRFVFCGWYKEETFDNLWDFENDKVTTTTTLYASWCPIGYNEYDYFKIQRIFNRPTSTQGLTMGECLNSSYYNITDAYNSEDPSTWDSIKWQIINNKKYVKEIRWGSNGLSGNIDLSNLSALTQINIYFCEINELDLSNDTSLNYLYCYYSNITSLNLNNDISLLYLDCNNNLLTSLDLSSNSALIGINCSYNQLTSLDISNMAALTSLNCGSNKLSLIKGNFYGKVSDILSNGNGYIGLSTTTFPNCTIYTTPISGSTFYNWTTADGAEISNSSGYAITSTLSDILYANFYQTVTFYNGTGSIYKSINLPYNAIVTAPATPMRTGYTFAGWYKEAECINEFDFDTENITQNINLYAKWNIKNYTVNFINGTVINSITADYNSLIAEPKPPTSDGLIFAGWSKSASYSYHYWNFNNDRVTNNITLYAIWSTTYLVSFNSQGGSNIDSVLAAKNLLLTRPPQPTRENNTFLGWYREPQCINEWNFDTNIVSNSMTLYAKWSTNKVSFESNGGSVIDSVWVPFGEAVSQPNIEKTGYTLAGWYMEPNYVNNWNFTSNKVTFDTTLYSKWNINSYTVSFNSNAGSAVNSIKADYNTKITAPIAPAKTGYTFAGWYKDTAFTMPWNFATDKVATEITLYAKWTINSYSITALSSNNLYGTVSGGGNYNYNSTVTFTANPKTGYMFNGWYNGTTLVSSNYIYSFKVTGKITLTAKFTYATAPSISSIKSAGYNSISISWYSTSAKYYEIYHSTSAKGTYTKIVTTSSTSYISTGLTCGKYYYYKIRAVYYAGVYTYSSYSAYKYAKPVPAAPLAITVNKYSSSSIKVSYNAVSGASGYQIYRATSLNGTYYLKKTTTSKYWVNTYLAKGKTYYYKVRAYRTVNGVRIYGPYTSVKYIRL